MAEVGAKPAGKPHIELSPNDIQLVDQRSAEQKKAQRTSVFAPIRFFDDAHFWPPELERFQAALLADESLARPIVIEVEDFRVADYYPTRLNTGGQGVVGDAIFRSLVRSNTDHAFVDKLQLLPKQDALICIFVGKINGVPSRVAVNEPYKVKLTALSVYKTDEFKNALDTVLKRAAAEAALQSRQPPAEPVAPSTPAASN